MCWAVPGTENVAKTEKNANNTKRKHKVFLILFMLLFIPQLITYFVGFHNIYVSFITYVFIILAVLNTNLFDELKLKAFKRLFYIIVIPTCIVIGINIIVTLLINDSYNVFKSFLSYCRKRFSWK